MVLPLTVVVPVTEPPMKTLMPWPLMLVIVGLLEMVKFATPSWPLNAARIALLPIRFAPDPPLIELPVITIGVPLAPNVEEVPLPPLPLPPPITIPSPLGKLVIVLLETEPVVMCELVPAEPCASTRMAEPSEVVATVELVRVLPV